MSHTSPRPQLASKRRETLFLTATVYDHRLSELRWLDAPREYRAWSNVDFNDLAGLREIETADTVYSLVFAVSNLASADLAKVPAPSAGDRLARLQEGLSAVSPRESFTPPRSTLVLSGNAGYVPTGTLAALEALHLYYDAHRAVLVEQSARLAAERAAQAEAERAQTTQPRQTIIQFWPEKSRNYPAAK